MQEAVQNALPYKNVSTLSLKKKQKKTRVFAITRNVFHLSEIEKTHEIY